MGRIFRYLLIFPTLLACLVMVSPKIVRADIIRGIAAYDGGDYATALHELRLAARKGHPMAQTILAGFYLLGDGVQQDYKLARHWFEKAAGNGVANAQLNLGLMYRDGLGVGRDVVEAYKWIAIASSANKQLNDYLKALEKHMMQADITRARRYALAWHNKHQHQ